MSALVIATASGLLTFVGFRVSNDPEPHRLLSAGFMSLTRRASVDGPATPALRTDVGDRERGHVGDRRREVVRSVGNWIVSPAYATAVPFRSVDVVRSVSKHEPAPASVRSSSRSDYLIEVTEQ